MPSPHAVPQHSSIQPSALCPVNTLSHIFQSYIALLIAHSTRRPKIFTHSPLCPITSEHATTPYSPIHRTAYDQSTRCPTVSTVSSLCPIPSPHAAHNVHPYIALPYEKSTPCPKVFTHKSLCPMPCTHAAPQYSLLHRSALCPVHTQSHSIHLSNSLPYAQYKRCPTVFIHPSLCPMPSPHAAPQYSLLHRSALCRVHTLHHSIYSSIALPYVQSARCPTVFATPSLCPMLSPHAVPHYSFLHRTALRPIRTLFHIFHSYISLPYAQSTRCPAVFTHISFCPMPSPNAAPQYSLLHCSTLCPVHTLSHSFHSYIALPFANSTRCHIVFTPTSLCPMPSPHAFPHYSLSHRSALCPVHTLSHSIHPSTALPYAHSTRCPKIFTPPPRCPMPIPHAFPQYSPIHRSAQCSVHTLSHSFHSYIALL
jgi:hypothetical protein